MPYNYLTESRIFDETETIGSFKNGNSVTSFDKTFEKTRNELLESMDIMKNMGNPALAKQNGYMDTYKNMILSPLQQDCEQIQEQYECTDSYTLDSGLGSTYDVTSTLWDNVLNEQITESSMVGNLLPIKSIDFPLLYKANVACCANLIMKTEATTSPVIRKRIEQEYVYDQKNPKERWKWPQCVYDQETFDKISAAANGIPIKNDKVDLPLNNYDIITELTDAESPERENFTMDLRIVKAYVGDQVINIKTGGMRIALDDGQFRGGRIKQKLPDGTEIDEQIFGSVDWVNKTINVVSSGNGTGITAVEFAGKLSNVKNERTVRFDRDREEVEFKIDDGPKIDMPLFLEDLQDAKALLNIDLYQWAYGRFAETLDTYEDNTTLKFLDDAFERYNGIEIDPIMAVDPDYSFVSHMKFDCDMSTTTTALQSEYISNMLKFHIDQYLVNIADTVKLDNLTFVMYGNPRVIRLLNPDVKWVRKAGGRLGGVTLDFSYGLYTSGDITVQVVQSKKLPIEKYKGIRVIPYPTDNNTYTFKRYKYAYHILDGGKDNNYRAADLPGGSKTYVVGTTRFTNTYIQAIQGQIDFENAQFLRIRH